MCGPEAGLPEDILGLLYWFWIRVNEHYFPECGVLEDGHDWSLFSFEAISLWLLHIR